MSNIDTKIIEIDSRIVDLTAPLELLEYDEFQEMHCNPESIVDDVLRILGSDSFSDQQKIIAALAVQNLDLEDFISFAEDVLILLENEDISSDVFDWAVFPIYEWNTKLAENYSSKQAQKLLDDILNSNKVGQEQKSYIREHLLTGRAEAQVRFLREIGQL